MQFFNNTYNVTFVYNVSFISYRSIKKFNFAFNKLLFAFLLFMCELIKVHTRKQLNFVYDKIYDLSITLANIFHCSILQNYYLLLQYGKWMLIRPYIFIILYLNNFRIKYCW